MLGIEQSLRGGLILCVETALLACGCVLAIESARMEEQDKPLFHNESFLVLNREPVRDHRVREALI